MFHAFDNSPDIDGRNANGDFVEYDFGSRQYAAIERELIHRRKAAIYSTIKNVFSANTSQ